MGTTRTGRYLYTYGAKNGVSQYALVHSSEGTFKWSRLRMGGKVVKRIRLASGGHGEIGRKLLDKYHIEYKIVKTYPNGVRVGHVTNHDQKQKRTGIGQSWFPKEWTPRTIRKAGEYVARIHKDKPQPDGVVFKGLYRGVRVCIIRTNGIIGTVFPDCMQPENRRK